MLGFKNRYRMAARYILLSVLVMLVSACGTKPSFVWVEKGVSFAGYQTIEVAPVRDETGGRGETGEAYEIDVPGKIAENIKDALEEKGYQLQDDTHVTVDALVIQTHLLKYDPGSVLGRWFGSGTGLGRARCTIRSFLVDKKTGNVLGEIVVPEVISEGGLLSIGAGGWVLGTVAQGVVDEVDRLIKGQERA